MCYTYTIIRKLKTKQTCRFLAALISRWLSGRNKKRTHDGSFYTSEYTDISCCRFYWRIREYGSHDRMRSGLSAPDP